VPEAQRLVPVRRRDLRGAVRLARQVVLVRHVLQVRLDLVLQCKERRPVLALLKGERVERDRLGRGVSLEAQQRSAARRTMSQPAPGLCRASALRRVAGVAAAHYVLLHHVPPMPASRSLRRESALAHRRRARGTRTRCARRSRRAWSAAGSPSPGR
jgi:hypothetical protein